MYVIAYGVSQMIKSQIQSLWFLSWFP